MSQAYLWSMTLGLLVGLTAGCGSTNDASTLHVSSIDAQTLEKIEQHPEFIDAAALLVAEGARLDSDSVYSTKGPEGFFVVFPVLQGKPDGATELIYEETQGGESMVYFNRPKSSGTDVSHDLASDSVHAQGIFGRCGDWSPWYAIGGQYCDSAFFCFGKGQLATYQDFRKQRECKRSTQIRNKREHDCGC
ncbi:hypothetical protein [Cystobacter fuscus]|uniref:hypothetical protein n=1 Tax=Cystobacter fuscus TaxID=43 RepID=UPI002B2F8CB5|nr:hypothetical protein F0U63_22115 [Cystobacter fuscus]